MEKRIHRDTENKAIGGVMSGLSDYFGGDPIIWRLGIILFALLTAVVPVVIVYALAWWLLPAKDGVTYRVID